MNPIADTSNVFQNGANTYFMVGKLTWLLNENNNISGAFNSQPTSSWGRTSYNASPSASVRAGNSNNTNVTLNYTGKFIDKHLLVEAKAGWFNSNSKVRPGVASNGVDYLAAPHVQWVAGYDNQKLAYFDPTFTCPLSQGSACVTSSYRSGGYGYVEPTDNNRYAGSVALTGLFELGGQHQLKGGAQIEYGTYASKRYYSGGGFFQAYASPNAQTDWAGNYDFPNYMYLARSFGQVAGLQPGTTNNFNFICASKGPNGECINPGLTNPALGLPINDNTTGTWTNGFFLQDSWTIANVLTLNFGVRLDMQQMNGWGPNGSPEAQSISINNMWAPRVQAIWDFTGNGRGKIQANWGMYYESIPLRLALRTFNGEPDANAQYVLSTCTGVMKPAQNPGFNPYQQCPDIYGRAAGVGGQTVDLATYSPDGTAALGYTISGANVSPIAPGLKGAYTQQFGGGIQYEVLQDLTLGVDYLGRRLGDIIEDMSSDNGVNYFIANPATSKPWTSTLSAYQGITFNPIDSTAVDPRTGQYFTVHWPKPERSYDSVAVVLNKLFSKRWLAQVSYTWSSLRGNYPGLFRLENAQLDPNITSEYDLAFSTGNKIGTLNLNRTHQIKAAGSYTATISPDVSLVPSVNFSAMSGYPVSATGSHPLYGSTDSYVLPRGIVGDLPWTYQLDAGLKLQWALSGPYTLQFSLDIFNLLNLAAVQWVDMVYTTSFTTPMQGAQCGGSNSFQSNPRDVLGSVQANCPDLLYARGYNGRRVTPNLTYGQPSSSGSGIYPYPAPVAARFGVQLSF
jgi:hypothetical protein